MREAKKMELVEVLNNIAEALVQFRTPGTDKDDAIRRALSHSCAGLRVVTELDWDEWVRSPGELPADLDTLLHQVRTAWTHTGLSEPAMAMLVEILLNSLARPSPGDPVPVATVQRLRDVVCEEADRQEEEVRRQAARYRLVKRSAGFIVGAVTFLSGLNDIAALFVQA